MLARNAIAAAMFLEALLGSGLAEHLPARLRVGDPSLEGRSVPSLSSSVAPSSGSSRRRLPSAESPSKTGPARPASAVQLHAMDEGAGG
jgi:hypothetical protein